MSARKGAATISAWLVLTLSSVAVPTPASELRTVEIAQAPQGRVTFAYRPDLAQLLLEELPDVDPARPDDPPQERIRVARFALSAGQPRDFVLEWESGPSADPCFTVIRSAEGTPTQATAGPWGHQGLRATLPGDGAIYIGGHVNSYTDLTGKWVYREGRLREVPQPAHFVGLESVALEGLVAYSDTSRTLECLRISKGEPVTVLLRDGERYLLRDRWGITGWWRPGPTVQEADQIGGFFFAGD